jgi:hypothetical protein
LVRQPRVQRTVGQQFVVARKWAVSGHIARLMEMAETARQA